MAMVQSKRYQNGFCKNMEKKLVDVMKESADERNSVPNEPYNFVIYISSSWFKNLVSRNLAENGIYKIWSEKNCWIEWKNNIVNQKMYVLLLQANSWNL